MVNSNSEVEDDQVEISFLDIKEKIHMYSKEKLTSLSHILVDEYHNIYSEKTQLMNAYASFKSDQRSLEVNKKNLKRLLKN